MSWGQWLLLLAIMTAYVSALSWFWEAYFGRRATEEVGVYDSEEWPTPLDRRGSGHPSTSRSWLRRSRNN